MIRAIYPGSFDPVTLGHLDLIERAARMADELIIGVLVNTSKNPLFSIDERVNMLKKVTKGFSNVTVEAYEGLLVNFAAEKNASVIVRGLRMVTDFEYELQLAQTNRVMNRDVETLFLMTSLKYSYLSSSTVREALAFGTDISAFVPAELIEEIGRKADVLQALRS